MLLQTLYNCCRNLANFNVNLIQTKTRVSLFERGYLKHSFQSPQLKILKLFNSSQLEQMREFSILVSICVYVNSLYKSMSKNETYLLKHLFFFTPETFWSQDSLTLDCGILLPGKP